jgi:hypothetical protein
MTAAVTAIATASSTAIDFRSGAVRASRRSGAPTAAQDPEADDPVGGESGCGLHSASFAGTGLAVVPVNAPSQYPPARCVPTGQPG